MAVVVDALIGEVISKAVEMGADQLVQMGNSLHHLKDNISSIERYMRRLQCYLKDAEKSKKSGSPQVKLLISDIQLLAEKAMNILDSYLPEFERYKTKGPFGCIKYASCFLCYGAKAKSFASEVDNIKTGLQEIEVSMTNCGIRPNDDDGAEVWDDRKKFLHTRNSKVFGRETTLQVLKEKIHSQHKQCKIISIVGPGGVGKTTLGKKIYQEMKNEFQCSARVYVSKMPNVDELLLEIAKQVGLHDDKIRENLEDNLRLFLHERKYLILLDDIWEAKPWNRLGNVLVTDSENGSRIIISSRHTEVGRTIGGLSSLVPLDILREGEPKGFFNYLMLRTTEEDPLPKILEHIGEEIVNKCGGLPLAIEVAAGMLQAKERRVDAWKQVLESMNSGDENDECQKMLALSYQDLPDVKLKHLFLYFGIFPEDREIFVSELTPLWVTDEHNQVDGRSKNPDHIVEGNVEKLIARNLIQVSKRRDDGRIRSCRIHDLLHTLCVQVAKEDNVYCTWHKLKSLPGFEASIVHRVTSNSSSLNEHPNSSPNVRVPEKLRSLLCFNEDGEVLKFIKTSALDLNLLRFLIIEISKDDRETVELPDEICKLSNLIYFRLSGNFNEIPFTKGSFKKLETLEVVGSHIFNNVKVPEGILQTKHLKHVILQGWVNIIPRTEAVELVSPGLETLILNDYNSHSFTIDALENLSNLRRFRFYCRDELYKALLNGEFVWENLESLNLKLFDLDVYDFLNPAPSKPMLDLSRYQKLIRLRLDFAREMIHATVTMGIQFPLNLVSITLFKTDLHDDHMKSLKGLTKLEIIKLRKCSAEILDFSGENSFPQLQVLSLRDVSFREVVVDGIGMPNLYKVIFEPSEHQGIEILPQRLLKMMVTTDN